MTFDIVVIGGGAAGFYAALQAVEFNPRLRVLILEKGKEVLAKVKVSGGGRCNVTHAEFDPRELAKNYPRGEKELLGPFHTHGPGDTMAFLEEHGVALKIEEDGRIFPASDRSQTLIDFFLDRSKEKRIKVLKHSGVSHLRPLDEGSGEEGWEIISIRNTYRARKLLVATGSNAKIWRMLADLGHTIVRPVPSLFTFHVDDARIEGLSGITASVALRIHPKRDYGTKPGLALKSQVAREPLLEANGSMLITHWGLSGPAILRLSAWGARILNEMDYKFTLEVNWLPDYHEEGVMALLAKIKEVEAKKTILRTRAFDLPKRVWINLVKASGIDSGQKWGETSKKELMALAGQLVCSRFVVRGKSVFKEEFVTAGGVDLKEVDFKTFGSRLFQNLYFAGEILDIDAITGGFNFQNAWTGGYLAARAMAKP